MVGGRGGRCGDALFAVILAAGEGRRLWPLTARMPKPLMPVLNRPVFELLVDRLQPLGVTTVFANVHHHADVLTARIVNPTPSGIAICWRREECLTGPAGALLAFDDVLRGDQPILVQSGDVVHDVDLAAFVEAHRRSGADLSVVFRETTDAGRYGVGTIDDDGTVVAFAEKPPVPRDQSLPVSCGIYCVQPRLLAEFPRGCVFDFGADLIPHMVAGGRRVHAWVTGAYWNDIGSPAALLAANLDAATGVVDVRPPVGASMDGSVVVGVGVELGASATIAGPAVIGDGCRIGAGAYVSRSLLLDGAVVAPGTVVLDAVLAGCR
jgi:NDP-sugar pyrophosphorylase family protein